MKSWKASDYTRVYRIITGKINTYLIQNEHCFILYNCGGADSYKELMDRLQDCFVDPTEINYVIVNENYQGCKANLKKFRKQSEAKFISHNSLQIFRKIPPVEVRQKFNTEVKVGENVDSFDAAHFFPHSMHITYHDKLNMASLGINGYVFSDSMEKSSLCINNEIVLCGSNLQETHIKRRKLIKKPEIKDILQNWKNLLDTGGIVFLPSEGKPIEREYLFDKYRIVSRELTTHFQTAV